MAVVGEEDFLGYPSRPEPGRLGWFAHMAGTIVSVGLLAGLGVWGYKLAVRDVSGIPVVRALEGPMRIAPQDPGGEIADHTGLAVNEVAAEGVAAALPEQIVLAPRPTDLAAEDQPVAGASAPVAKPLAQTTMAQAVPQMDPIVPVVPAEQPSETPAAAAATDIAVETALAEALGAEPMQAEVLASAALAEPAPPGALLRSPRPERRPEGDGTAEAVVTPAALATDMPAQGGEVNAASITPGTRMVQLGAFDDEADARREWARLQAQFGDLIAPKALVLQTADSAGRRFVRLRALGFEDDADARRFCSALLAENAACIPVVYRP
jgi:hypothetical protein